MAKLQEERLNNSYRLGKRDHSEGQACIPPVYLTTNERDAYTAGYRIAQAQADRRANKGV